MCCLGVGSQLPCSNLTPALDGKFPLLLKTAIYQPGVAFLFLPSLLSPKDGSQLQITHWKLPRKTETNSCQVVQVPEMWASGGNCWGCPGLAIGPGVGRGLPICQIIGSCSESRGISPGPAACSKRWFGEQSAVQHRREAQSGAGSSLCYGHRCPTRG